MDLSEDVSSWKPGDQIVVASTDYSMYQTEEFTLLPCPECNKYQVKVKGKSSEVKISVSSKLPPNPQPRYGSVVSQSW